MRRLLICIGVVGCLLGSTSTVASAGSRTAAGSSTGSYPSGCKRVPFTADGGYFSMGGFYWEPGYDVTLVTNWCYSGGEITSYSIRWSTNIPSSSYPRFVTGETLGARRAILGVGLNGGYNSGILNNVGTLSIDGYVTMTGRHHFANESGAGG
jgi:hypothetical protein